MFSIYQMILMVPITRDLHFRGWATWRQLGIQTQLPKASYCGRKSKDTDRETRSWRELFVYRWASSMKYKILLELTFALFSLNVGEDVLITFLSVCELTFFAICTFPAQHVSNQATFKIQLVDTAHLKAGTETFKFTSLSHTTTYVFVVIITKWKD